MLYFTQTISEMILKTLLFSLIILTGMALARSNELYGAQVDQKIKQLKKESVQINQQINKNTAVIEAFSQKEAEVIESLNETEIALHQAKKQASKFRLEMDELEQKIHSTKKLSQKLKKEIRLAEDYASQRMVALYKLNCLGKMNVLASADSVTAFLQRKAALERILAYDETVLQILAENKKEFSRVMDEFKVQKEEILSLETAYNVQAQIMERKKKQRSILLASIREKKSLTRASIASLKRASTELDKKIIYLNKVKQKDQDFKKRQIHLSGKFASLKGLLKMPVKGKIISSFGRHKDPDLNVVNFRTGINIKAKKGDSIYAVYNGEVLYANWFKGYGNMMIIDHGDHYYTVYAHADEIFKKEGDQVKTGEAIGTIGDTASMMGPGLHFEVRHYGKSVDPAKWLKKS